MTTTRQQEFWKPYWPPSDPSFGGRDQPGDAILNVRYSPYCSVNLRVATTWRP